MAYAHWYSPPHGAHDSRPAPSRPALSGAFLERRHRKRLHDCPRWLGLDHDNLAKDLPLACLGCWLRARLDAAEVRDDKDAGLLHFSGSYACEASEDAGDCWPLQLTLVCDPH